MWAAARRRVEPRKLPLGMSDFATTSVRCGFGYAPCGRSAYRTDSALLLVGAVSSVSDILYPMRPRFLRHRWLCRWHRR